MISDPSPLSFAHSQRARRGAAISRRCSWSALMTLSPAGWTAPFGGRSKRHGISRGSPCGCMSGIRFDKQAAPRELGCKKGSLKCSTCAPVPCAMFRWPR
jgi:hypothetical protein